jgi:response regulator RpfG family c-di-GMP phosphodiesterase
VLDVLREEKGRQFDPEVVEAFFECYDVIKSISNKYPDE